MKPNNKCTKCDGRIRFPEVTLIMRDDQTESIVISEFCSEDCFESFMKFYFEFTDKVSNSKFISTNMKGGEKNESQDNKK